MKSSPMPSNSSGENAILEESSLRFFWKSTSFSESFFFSSVTFSCISGARSRPERTKSRRVLSTKRCASAPIGHFCATRLTSYVFTASYRSTRIPKSTPNLRSFSSASEDASRSFESVETCIAKSQQEMRGDISRSMRASGAIVFSNVRSPSTAATASPTSVILRMTSSVSAAISSTFRFIRTRFSLRHETAIAKERWNGRL
mmetsp:Transcript_54754/g.130035  ORF Transcript_54754/g.130035 Transcript_54754/m.130035 type:complete len:202 (-) Transcript_54754:2-607(-)